MKLVSLFSGIGAFEKALENLNIDHKVINYCEVDEYAGESYSAIHGIDKSFNLGDITKVKISDLKQGSADLITYGFPCQDISNAGKQKGFEDENGNLTRSGLFFYAASIIGRIQPKIAICENVKALAGKKFKKEFDVVLDTLSQIGYNNYWQVLNAEDYGIPQLRERVFVVSVRKDFDNGQFKFPKPFNLEKKLEDYLEKEVDKKYYFSNEALDRMTKWKSFQNPLDKVLGRKSVSPTITTRIAISDGGGINASTKLYSHKLTNEQKLRTGYHDLDIRYYTPKDCWLLMGFEVEDYIKAKKAIYDLPITDNQKEGCLYKQAGNSIVVNVLMELFKSLKQANLI